MTDSSGSAQFECHHDTPFCQHISEKERLKFALSSMLVSKSNSTFCIGNNICKCPQYPGKIVQVDDVKNPICPECHAPILQTTLNLAPEVKKVYSTTVEVKSANFKKFADLIGNQFNHGGDKYRLQGFDDREATDVISSIFGGETQFDWILGTMMKYLFRFKNFHREKDLLKIATYCYILWLKQGNHLKENHDEDTNKNTKESEGVAVGPYCRHYPNNPKCSICTSTDC